MKTVHYMSHWAHPSSILSRKPRSVTAEFKRDGEIDFRGKGACLCVSLGNVLGAPRRMDIKTHHSIRDVESKSRETIDMIACGLEVSAVAVVTDERDWTRKYSFILGGAQDLPHWWPLNNNNR